MAKIGHNDDKDRPRQFRAVTVWVGVAASLAVIVLAIILYNISETKLPRVPEVARELRLENATVIVLEDPEAAATNIGAELKRVGIEVLVGHNDGNPTLAAKVPENKINAVSAIIKPYTVPPDRRLAFEFRKTASGK